MGYKYGIVVLETGVGPLAEIRVAALVREGIENLCGGFIDESVLPEPEWVVRCFSHSIPFPAWEAERCLDGTIDLVTRRAKHQTKLAPYFNEPFFFKHHTCFDMLVEQESGS